MVNHKDVERYRDLMHACIKLCSVVGLRMQCYTRNSRKLVNTKTKLNYLGLCLRNKKNKVKIEVI